MFKESPALRTYLLIMVYYAIKITAELPCYDIFGSFKTEVFTRHQAMDRIRREIVRKAIDGNCLASPPVPCNGQQLFFLILSVKIPIKNGLIIILKRALVCLLENCWIIIYLADVYAGTNIIKAARQKIQPGNPCSRTNCKIINPK